MKSDIINVLGKNIAKTRKELGLSQQQLAEKLEITQRVLCSYERGSRTMPVIMLPKIAKELNVPVNFLLGENYNKYSLDERTRKARLLRELEKLEKVPSEDQKSIFNLIDSLASKQVAPVN